MSVTIYHNPGCSNSRRALELIREAGVAPVIVEYLTTPLDAAALKALLARMGASAGDVVREKEAVYSELNLADADEDRLITALVAHPILLNRPIVVRQKGAKLCRPGEAVKELL
ncbi:MAG TPA: arsenate reductase (glutaredoxin) [Rhizomicrobium sp.]|jgi:arsenate reductase